MVDFESFKNKNQPSRSDGLSHSPSGHSFKETRNQHPSPLKEPTRKVNNDLLKSFGVPQSLRSRDGTKTLIVRDESGIALHKISIRNGTETKGLNAKELVLISRDPSRR